MGWSYWQFNNNNNNINIKKGNKRRRMRGKVNAMNEIYVCLLLELDLCKVNLGTLGPTIKTDEATLMFYSSPCL